MSDSKCRYGGDWEGDLWSWYNHVELGQLCGIMRDVPSDEGLCYMLQVVLKREELLRWYQLYSYFFGLFNSVDLNIDLRLLKGFALCVFPSAVCQVWLGARCGLMSCATHYYLVHP